MDELHSIVLRADGTVVRGLTMETFLEGTRDRSMFPKDVRGAGIGVLVDESRIRFRTLTGKAFWLSLDEFSFLINDAAAAAGKRELAAA